MEVDSDVAAAEVVFLDTLLDDDVINNAPLHRHMDNTVEECELLSVAAMRQTHSRPTLYSEHWIGRYSDDDFKSNFRLSREKFNMVLTTCVLPQWEVAKAWSVEPQKALEMTLWYLATQVIYLLVHYVHVDYVPHILSVL